MKKTTTAILVLTLALMLTTSCKKSQNPITIFYVLTNRAWVSTSVIDSSTSGNIDSSKYLSYTMVINLNHQYYGTFYFQKMYMGNLACEYSGSSILKGANNDSLYLINALNSKDTGYFVVKNFTQSKLTGVLTAKLQGRKSTSIITFK